MSRLSGEAGPPYTLLEAGLGTGVDPALLEQALTHRSYAYEHGGLPTNERLEFLGDAVLGLVVTDALYQRHPDLPEGSLAKLRASVVNARALAGVARSLQLGRWLRLGRGEQVTGGRDKTSILADTMEAVIGAVYLDRGIPVVTTMVRALFDPLMSAASQDGAELDWKTALQEITAARGLGVPDYRLTGSGPDHARSFVAEVRVAGEVQGCGSGRSKKQAEQQAAEQAWTVLSGPAVAGPAVAGESLPTGA
ncbi:MAG: ribonuclease III [Actinobacteria bacterium]|nr:ribonuclease III [Actinomycetota bacterium]MBW3647883.1 ribonuclease III [Actinomycetota bacterium]